MQVDWLRLAAGLVVGGVIAELWVTGPRTFSLGIAIGVWLMIAILLVVDGFRRKRQL